jgi:magnesium transporter
MARFLKSRQRTKGKVPGSVVFIGKQKMDSPKISIIQFNQVTFKEESLDEISGISDYVSDDLITWINIDGLHDTYLIENLGEQFGISSLILEDIVNTDQRPTIQEHENNIAVILKSFFFVKDDLNIHAEQISFVLLKNCLITLQERVGDFFEHVRGRIRKNRGRIRSSGADYLCYALIDALFESYFENLELMGNKIEALDDRILKNFKKEIIEEIYQLKTDLNYIRKSTRPLTEILARLNLADSAYVQKKTKRFLVDLEDIGKQIYEIVESYSTIINDQLNLYNTTINNNANEVMKVLTIFAAIFIPLTFIAGIYGTNFDYLPELHYKYSYLFFWLALIAIAGGMLVYFRKKKWL